MSIVVLSETFRLFFPKLSSMSLIYVWPTKPASWYGWKERIIYRFFTPLVKLWSVLRKWEKLDLRLFLKVVTYATVPKCHTLSKAYILRTSLHNLSLYSVPQKNGPNFHPCLLLTLLETFLSNARCICLCQRTTSATACTNTGVGL